MSRFCPARGPWVFRGIPQRPRASPGSAGTVSASHPASEPQAASVSGESASFDQRLMAAGPALLAFARRMGVEEAEDLCQEALARALRYRSSFDPTRPLLPWLRRVLLHTRADRGRLQRPQPLEEDPAQREASAEAGQQVEQLLKKLEPEDARLLRAFHLEQRSIQDLARSLDTPEGTLRSRLHRARRRLAQIAQPTED